MGGQWRRRGGTEFIVALLEGAVPRRGGTEEGRYPAASLAEQGKAWAKGEGEG